MLNRMTNSDEGHKFYSPTCRRMVGEMASSAIQRGFKKRQKWTSAERNVQRGDFVLLLDDTTPPVSRYPYATVCGHENVQRREKYVSVTVRMEDGRVRERDIRKIVLLEAVISDQSADCSATEERNDCITNDDEPFCTRL